MTIDGRGGGQQPASDAVTLEAVHQALPAVRRLARVTPVVGDHAGGRGLLLKAETLQLTGAFKIRGAAAKLAALGPAAAQGVVCASAGNHGMAVAAAARAAGVPCEVFVPQNTPVVKRDAIRGFGGRLRTGGLCVEECLAAATEVADRRGVPLVHPYEDPAVIAGQGTIGLELLQQAPGVRAVVVPVGGGGLISGIALAVKELAPWVRVVGVRADDPSATIADGIAVKRPGAVTSTLIERYVDELVAVGDEQIADAMAWCLRHAGVVAEPAGAAAVAAILSGAIRSQPGPVVAVVSGGNVDAALLEAACRRRETQAGRRLVLRTRLDDRPGALAALLGSVAETGANVLDLQHLRDGLDLPVKQAEVELVLATADDDHGRQLTRALSRRGYALDVPNE